MSFYAVDLRGTSTGGGTTIVKSWEECSALVSGVRRARFKKLATRAEAEQYLKNGELAAGGGGGPTEPPRVKPLPAVSKIDFTLSSRWLVYSDGSRISGISSVAWGWSLIYETAGEEVLVGDQLGLLERHNASNVDAELYAVQNAMSTLAPALREAAKTAGGVARTVAICYDYAGVEEWALKRWKAKRPVSENYQRSIQAYLEWMTFSKIIAHGANRWNDRIDKLVRGTLRRSRSA